MTMNREIIPWNSSRPSKPVLRAKNLHLIILEDYVEILNMIQGGSKCISLRSWSWNRANWLKMYKTGISVKKKKWEKREGLVTMIDQLLEDQSYKLCQIIWQPFRQPQQLLSICLSRLLRQPLDDEWENTSGLILGDGRWGLLESPHPQELPYGLNSGNPQTLYFITLGAVNDNYGPTAMLVDLSKGSLGDKMLSGK